MQEFAYDLYKDADYQYHHMEQLIQDEVNAQTAEIKGIYAEKYRKAQQSMNRQLLQTRIEYEDEKSLLNNLIIIMAVVASVVILMDIIRNPIIIQDFLSLLHLPTILLFFVVIATGIFLIYKFHDRFTNIKGLIVMFAVLLLCIYGAELLHFIPGMNVILLGAITLILSMVKAIWNYNH